MRFKLPKFWGRNIFSRSQAQFVNGYTPAGMVDMKSRVAWLLFKIHPVYISGLIVIFR